MSMFLESSSLYTLNFILYIHIYDQNIGSKRNKNNFYNFPFQICYSQFTLHFFSTLSDSICCCCCCWWDLVWWSLVLRLLSLLIRFHSLWTQAVCVVCVAFVLDKLRSLPSTRYVFMCYLSSNQSIHFKTLRVLPFLLLKHFAYQSTHFILSTTISTTNRYRILYNYHEIKVNRVLMW